MDFKRARTIYDQIADHICENILQQRWQIGDRIPSVREMAVQIEVNPNTVMRAFSSLQDRGVIVNQRGIGYFVAENAKMRVREMKKDEFIHEELPELLKTMDLLEISVEDLKAMIEAARDTGKEYQNEAER
jgi:DNA-binding transcriptional regulator YhcF (GntR family)